MDADLKSDMNKHIDRWIYALRHASPSDIWMLASQMVVLKITMVDESEEKWENDDVEDRGVQKWELSIKCDGDVIRQQGNRLKEIGKNGKGVYNDNMKWQREGKVWNSVENYMGYLCAFVTSTWKRAWLLENCVQM